MKILIYFILILFILFIGYFLYLKKIYTPINKEITYKLCETSSIFLDNEIKLLSWNIHKENYKKAFQIELNRIKNNLKLSFILLQEFNIKQNFTKEKKCSYEKIFAPNTKVNNKSEFTGLLTMSKSNSIYKKTYLTTNKEFITNTPKIFLVTEYNLRNTYKTLLVINMHAINFKLGLKEYIEQMKALTNILDKHNGIKIISGDFNSWNIKRLEYLKKIMKQQSLNEVNFENKKVTKIFNNQIDHIFYSNDLEIINTKIINTKSSDHKPLYVKFKIKNPI